MEQAKSPRVIKKSNKSRTDQASFRIKSLIPDLKENIHSRDAKGYDFPIQDANKLIFRVKRINVQREKRFHLDDHLYTLTLDSSKRKTPPGLHELQSSLKTAITEVLLEIQTHYTQEQHRQIYLTFNDEHFSRGSLYTGNYSLFSPEKKKFAFDDDRQIEKDYLNQLVTRALMRLESLLRSNDYIELDKSFHINIKVLSVAVNQIQKFKTGNETDSEPELLQRRFLNDGDKCHLRVPNILPNHCIFTAIIIGYYYKRYKKHILDETLGAAEDAKLFNSILKYCNNPKSRRGRIILFDKIVESKLALKMMDNDGPFVIEEIVPQLAKFWKIQVHVYSNFYRGGKPRYSYPNLWTPSLPQINLLEERVGKASAFHVSVIKNREIFFCHLSFECHSCKKSLYTSQRHNCKGVLRSCFACRRYIVTPDCSRRFFPPDIDITTKNQFCLRKTALNLTSSTGCDVCGVKIVNEECLRQHRKYNCNGGEICTACNKL